jgi:hypothetical protein
MDGEPVTWDPDPDLDDADERGPEGTLTDRGFYMPYDDKG